MKWCPSILEVEKGVELKADLQSLHFMLLSLGMPYYKEECKLNWSEEDRVLKYKIKIKERHSSTSRARRIVFGDF